MKKGKKEGEMKELGRDRKRGNRRRRKGNIKESLGETGREVIEGKYRGKKEELGRDRGGCKKGQEKGEIKEEFERDRERVYKRGRTAEIKEKLRQGEIEKGQ